MKRVKQNPSREKKIAEAELRRFRELYDRLKAELTVLGYVCQGTITRRYLPCGKLPCACRKDPGRRHGPYYYWTAKMAGRTQSRMLTPAMVPLYREGIRNHQRIQAILKRMRKISLQAFEAAKIRSKV